MSDRASPPVRAVITSGVTPGVAASSAPVSGTTRLADTQLAAPVREPTPGSSAADPRAPSCPRCHALSQPGMRFCRECGGALGPAPGSRGQEAVSQRQPIAEAAIARSCWRCQAERTDNASFCRQCGASLIDPSMEAALRTTPRQSPPSDHAQPEPGLPARLVTLLKDGSEGRSIPLTEGDADIGTREGEVTFPDDPYMSSRHARISCRAGTCSLRDLDSVNGVYVRLREEVDLHHGDMVLIGQQVMRFELLSEGELSLGPAWQRGVLVFGTPEAARFARLVQYTTEGVGRDVHYLFRDETVIGRENGDIVFTDDPFLSRRHASLRVDHAGRRVTLHDLGSSNGTALRIRGEHVLRDGDQFRIGRHLFRFEAGPMGGRAGR
jgi:pSer/pThr/pTyr-binding forkhead associated (FHA) protein